jgi:hypothetical protein
LAKIKIISDENLKNASLLDDKNDPKKIIGIKKFKYIESF